MAVEQPAGPATTQGLAFQTPAERARAPLRHLLHRGPGAAAHGAGDAAEPLPVRAALVPVQPGRGGRRAGHQPRLPAAGSWHRGVVEPEGHAAAQTHNPELSSYQD